MDLLRTETLAVRARVGRGSALCFVVFDPMGDDRRLDRPAFGEAFFARYGFDAIHVLSTSNNWYQDPVLPDALAVIRDAVAPYGRVITYGSSMGGYAALRLAQAVGANTAIAISPQYSVHGAAIPFEKRWAPERQKLAWHHERPNEALPHVPEVFVFHDPSGADGLHAKAIARDLPHARFVPLPHAGHPAGAILVETGLLSSAVRDAAHGRLDQGALAALVRSRRHRSGQYLFTLARRQPVWRLRLKERLARRAVAAVPDEPVYLSYAGLVAECMGRPDAIELHRRAVERPGFGVAEMRLAHALWRAGLWTEAALATARAEPGVRHDLVAMSTIELLQALSGTPEPFLAHRGVSGSMIHPRLGRQMLKLARSRVAGERLRAWLGRRLAAWAVPNTILDRRNILDELALADRE